MESFTNSCRLCLWKGDKMLPIFKSPDDDETASKIRKCLPLDVRWQDNLPKGICASCLYKVEMLYEFHCSSVRVDSLLRKYLVSEAKDTTFREQPLSSSVNQAATQYNTRSVATGTEDEYVPSARTTRDCRENSSGIEHMVARVRVRTPLDISDVNSVGAASMILLPLRQSDPKGSDGRTIAVSSLVHRPDNAQGTDSVNISTIGATEQSPLSSTSLRLSASSSTVQQEQSEESVSRQPEPAAHTSSEGEACVTQGPMSVFTTTGDTDIVCLTVKSSPTVMQNDLSTSQPSCECPDDDDEVVVLAEYQKPTVHRRSKTPTNFDSTSASDSTPLGGNTTGPRRKTQRLCARHQEYWRLMNLQQESPTEPSTSTQLPAPHRKKRKMEDLQQELLEFSKEHLNPPATRIVLFH